VVAPGFDVISLTSCRLSRLSVDWGSRPRCLARIGHRGADLDQRSTRPWPARERL